MQADVLYSLFDYSQELGTEVDSFYFLEVEVHLWQWVPPVSFT